MDTVFKRKLEDALSNKAFMRFDTFIIKEMGFELPEEEDYTVRRNALKEFRTRTGRREFASAPTMRKWFGIGGNARPSRDIVFEICFALGADKDKTEEYLTKGLGEPGFRINDYQEMIFLYGIENEVSFDNCVKMIGIFEDNLDNDVQFSKTHTTRELYTQYQSAKGKDMKSFLFWMNERNDWFRGYSVTTLEYMNRLKDSILEHVREDAAQYIEPLLHDTGYYKWYKTHRLTCKNHREGIQKFINRRNSSGEYYVNKADREDLMYMSKLAYSERNTNEQIIAEVFSQSDNYSNKNDDGSISGIKKMSKKYLSDLFNVPIHKENLIRVSQAMRTLAKMDNDDRCPEWISDFGMAYTKGNGDFSSVYAANKSLNDYAKENKRRTLLIKRVDLLPLIFHLSQLQYCKQSDNQYNAEDAKRYFINIADMILNACNMDKISTEYELDVALLTCFQEEEMYQYSDVLDTIHM